MADATDILITSFDVHADLLGRLQRDYLANIMKERRNHQLIPSLYTGVLDSRTKIVGSQYLRA